jgi:hypothetical protein
MDLFALEEGTNTCPETSAWNYQFTMRKIPEERRSKNVQLPSHRKYFISITNITRLMQSGT